MFEINHKEGISQKASSSTCSPTAPPTRALTPSAIPSTNSSGPWMAPWRSTEKHSNTRRGGVTRSLSLSLTNFRIAAFKRINVDLVRLVEEGLYSLRQPSDQAERIPQHVQTQNQHVHLLDGLRTKHTVERSRSRFFSFKPFLKITFWNDQWTARLMGFSSSFTVLQSTVFVHVRGSACPSFIHPSIHLSHLLGIMADDLPLQLLGGAELEGQLKESQPGVERTGEER